MKILKVNDGIMGNSFVFIMYQATNTTANQVSDSVTIDSDQYAIVKLMGNDKAILDDLERLELRLYKKDAITTHQGLLIAPIETISDREGTSDFIQMEQRQEEDVYMVDLLPYIRREKIEHHFLIKTYPNDSYELYVRTGDEKCAKINFIFKEMKTIKKQSQVLEQVYCQHYMSTNIQDGMLYLNTPLIHMKGKDLSINLSINYSNNEVSEQIENTFNSYLPKNWSFNYQQYVGKIADSHDYYYINNRRQVMRFKKINDRVYIEESGTGIILTTIPKGCIITDVDQTKYIFDSGYLTKIEKGKLSLTIDYEKNSTYQKRIRRLIDSSNREVYFTYETGKIIIQSEHSNEIRLIIKDNQLQQICEPNNTNEVNNNIEYTYENNYLKTIKKRKEKVDITYHTNNSLSKIEAYRNEEKKQTIDFTYQITNTVVEMYSKEKTEKETITKKYYFDETKEFVKSVEVVNGKEENEEKKEEEAPLFIDSQDKEEHEFLIAKLPETGENYTYENRHSIKETFTIKSEYDLKSISEEFELYLSIQVYSQKAYFDDASGCVYNVDARIEVYNQEQKRYETLINTINIFHSFHSNIHNNEEFPSGDSIIYMSIKKAIHLDATQKKLLLENNKMTLSLTSERIITLCEPQVVLTLRTKRIPIYFTNEKIATSCIDENVCFFFEEQPYRNDFKTGYGLLEYPNTIQYLMADRFEDVDNHEITINNMKITYKDILMNQRNNYNDSNLFYYNNLHDVIDNVDYTTLKIGNKNGTTFFKDLQMTQKGYQRSANNSIIPVYVVNGYQQVGTKSQMFQQQIQLFIDETSTDDFFDNNDTKKESMFVYDENMHLIEEVFMYNYKEPYVRNYQAYFNGFTNVKIKYTYDDYGNLIKKIVGTFDIYDGNVYDNEEIYEIIYTYDAQKNFVIKETIYDGQNRTTINYEYDMYGNLIKETRPNENTIQYTYSNYFKQLTKVKQQDTTHTLTYENNLLTQITNTKNMAYQYQYNAKEDIYKINYKTSNATNLLEEYTEVEAKPNNVFNLTKGETGYLVEYSNLNRIGYAYDKYGRIIKQYMYSSKTDLMEVTAVYIYGEERLTDETSIYEIESETDERIHTNEKSKLRMFIDYYANTKTVYKYNKEDYCIEKEIYDLTTKKSKMKITQTIENNYLTASTIKDVTLGEEKSILAQYIYDEQGRLIQEDIHTKANNRINIYYEYDNCQRMTEFYCDYVSESYTYEGANIKSFSSILGDADYEIVLDEERKIKEIKENKNTAKQYTYNKLGYLTKEIDNNQNKQIEYIYDEEANIKEKHVKDLSGTSINDIVYTYDTNDTNKLIRITQNNQTTNLTYDEIFNVTSYQNMTFSYERGRLLSKVTKGNQNYSYIYNSEGQRIQKENNGIKIEYTYQNNRLMKELVINQTGNLVYEINYIYTTNKRIGFEYNKELYVYEYDILGNIVGICDKNRKRKASYTYDAWGNHTVYNANNEIDTDENSIGNINKVRYKGYYYDVETGLFYCNSRYYSPELGRFIQPADIFSLNPSIINGLNLYSYANNNPINFLCSNSSTTGSASVGGGMISSIGASNSLFGQTNSSSISKGGLNFGWLANGLDTGSTIHGLYTSISGLVNHTAYFAKNLAPFMDDMTMHGASMKDGVLAFNQFSWNLGKSDVFGIVLGVGLDIYDSVQRGVSPGGVALGATLTAAKGVGLIYLNKGIMYGATALGSAICPGVGTVVGFVVGGVVCIVVDIFVSNWLDDLIDKIAK